MSKRKLLLADDSVTIQKVVNLTFADEGIEVITVGDGDAAIERIGADRPNIVLADVNMPGLNGYQICELLRSDEGTRDVPVILLVGSFEPFDEAEAARVGANAYLTKPFQSIRQLVAQVSDLMDAAATAETVPQPTAEAETVRLELPVAASEEKIAESPITPAEMGSPAGTAQAQNFDDLGYPSSPPDQPANPRTEDIDGLYEQSLSSGVADDLSEIGIDDEMIETSYAAATPQQENADLDYGHSAEADEPAQIEEHFAETAEPQQVNEPQPSSEHQAYYPQNADDPSRFESTIAYENWQPADMREAESESQQTQVETAHAAPAIGEDTIRMDGRFDTTGSSNFHFDEVNLLDLENSTNPEVEITTPLNAIEQGSNKQVVSISPELIEMIAQRVVEKMSEKY